MAAGRHLGKLRWQRAVSLRQHGFLVCLLQRNSCLLSFNGTLIIGLHDHIQAVNLVKCTNSFSSRPTKQLLLPQSSLSGVYSFLKMYSHIEHHPRRIVYTMSNAGRRAPRPRATISPASKTDRFRFGHLA